MPASRLLGEVSNEMLLTTTNPNSSLTKKSQTEVLPDPFGQKALQETDSELVEFGTSAEIFETESATSDSRQLTPEPELLTIEKDEFDLGETILSSQPLISPNVNQEETISPGPLLGLDTTNQRDELKIEIRKENQVQAGNGALFEVFLKNNGAETFDNLKLRAAFGSELFLPGRQTRDLGQQIAQLDPDQEIRIPLTLFSETPGRHCVRFSLLDGKGNELAGESSCVQFVPEVVQLKIAGPDICSIDSPTRYLLQVKNLSEQDLHQVAVNLMYDSVLEFQNASSSPQTTDNKLTWNLAHLPAGESISFETTFRCKTVSDNTSLVLNVTTPDHPEGTAATFLKIERPLSPVDLSFISESSIASPNQVHRVRIRCQNRGLKDSSDGVVQLELPEGTDYAGHRWGNAQDEFLTSYQPSSQQISLKCPEKIKTGEEQDLEISFRFREKGVFTLPVRFSSRQDHVQMDRIYHILVSEGSD